ncbi:MAG: hypothetical protein K2X07_01895 [Caulobacteraceae bacterium]|nr:hypothetical protein [Caulobacteraceae bacterium]
MDRNPSVLRDSFERNRVTAWAFTAQLLVHQDEVIARRRFGIVALHAASLAALLASTAGSEPVFSADQLATAAIMMVAGMAAGGLSLLRLEATVMDRATASYVRASSLDVCVSICDAGLEKPDDWDRLKAAMSRAHEHSGKELIKHDPVGMWAASLAGGLWLGASSWLALGSYEKLTQQAEVASAVEERSEGAERSPGPQASPSQSGTDELPRQP